ncbi:RING-H2 finger protein ATL1 [Linum grandiflorum]
MYSLIVVQAVVGAIILLVVMIEICSSRRRRQQQTTETPAPAAGITNNPPLPGGVVTGKVVKYANWVSDEKIDEEKGGGGGRECSICLEEFKGEEECRVLTVCGHIYHRDCIDLWLADENHCPLCRGSVRRTGRLDLDAVDGNHIDRI